MVYKNVSVKFLGADEDSDLKAEIKKDNIEMVIDIQDRNAADHYLIKGELDGTYYVGKNEHGSAKGIVNARWAFLGNIYVGLWIENGDEMLFSFRLPE